jgi:glycosyltransferase involved in cell wall biosynthesis
VSAIFTLDPLSCSADDLIRVSALSNPVREARPEPLGDSLQADELMNLLKSNLSEAACRRLGLVDLPAGLKLSIVIPVYNELQSLREMIRRVQAVKIPKEIVLVDDCSTDGTRDLLRKIEAESPGREIRVFYHEQNQGKGAALRTGFKHVSGTIVVVQDADLEYDPSEYLQLIEPIIDGRADVVYGSRFIGETHRVLFFWHYVGNHLLTILSNMFTGLNLTDMETCYKVFRREVIDEIGPKLKSDRFGFEPEVTAKIAARKLRVYERPISYSGRTYCEGKKITWRDGLQALWCIIRFRFVD